MESIYPNVDRYLLLKQLLVTIKLASMGAVMNTAGAKYSLPDQQHLVIKTIKDISTDFTIPYGLLRGGKVYIDFSRINEHMEAMCNGPIPEDAWEQKYIHALTDRKQLLDCILHYPICDGYIEEHAENLRNHNHYNDGRECAGKLIETSERALDVVEHWALGQSGVTLEQCIMMVNACALVEYLFNLTNDTQGIEDISDDDIPGC